MNIDETKRRAAELEARVPDSLTPSERHQLASYKTIIMIDDDDRRRKAKAAA